MKTRSYKLTRLDHRERIWRSALTAGWPIGIAFTSIIVTNEISLCGFAAMTGLPCPFCGGTRACTALAALDVPKAWHRAPGVLIAVAFAAIHTVFLLTEAVVGRRLGWDRLWLLGWKAIGCIIVVAWLTRLAVS
jgi:hypothetical protein